jgi:carbon-monoxide dehydrogenase small subunit
MAEEHIPEEEVRDDPEGAPEDESLQVSRRQFLIGAGAGAVVGAAAGVGVAGLRSGPGQAPEVVREAAAPEGAAAPAAPAEEVVVSELPATMREVTLNIDGVSYDVVVDVRESLWDTMTDKLGLGSRINLGCDRLQCGACGVLVDGRSVNGCAILSARLGRGQEIVTVRGITTGTRVEDLHPIQTAYMENLGFQCAICSRGFIMSTYALLAQNLDPTEEEVRKALEGNICRCGNYTRIMDSVFAAAETMRATA